MGLSMAIEAINMMYLASACDWLGDDELTRMDDAASEENDAYGDDI